MTLFNQKWSHDIDNVLLVISLFPLCEDTPIPADWAMVFMLWKVHINLEAIASDPYPSTLINATLLYWLPNVVTSNLKFSIGDLFLINRKPNEYDV